MPASPSFPHARQHAQALADRGDLAGARAVLESAVNAGRPGLAGGDPELLSTMRQLAALQVRAGDHMSARRVLEEAVESGNQRGESDPLALLLAYDLAVVATELGNRYVARTNFGRVARFGPAALGPAHPAVEHARRVAAHEAGAPPAVPGPAPAAPPVPFVPGPPPPTAPPRPITEDDAPTVRINAIPPQPTTPVSGAPQSTPPLAWPSYPSPPQPAPPGQPQPGAPFTPQGSPFVPQQQPPVSGPPHPGQQFGPPPVSGPPQSGSPFAQQPPVSGPPGSGSGSPFAVPPQSAPPTSGPPGPGSGSPFASPPQSAPPGPGASESGAAGSDGRGPGASGSGGSGAAGPASSGAGGSATGTDASRPGSPFGGPPPLPLPLPPPGSSLPPLPLPPFAPLPEPPPVSSPPWPSSGAPVSGAAHPVSGGPYPPVSGGAYPPGGGGYPPVSGAPYPPGGSLPPVSGPPLSQLPPVSAPPAGNEVPPLPAYGDEGPKRRRWPLVVTGIAVLLILGLAAGAVFYFKPFDKSTAADPTAGPSAAPSVSPSPTGPPAVTALVSPVDGAVVPWPVDAQFTVSPEDASSADTVLAITLCVGGRCYLDGKLDVSAGKDTATYPIRLGSAATEGINSKWQVRVDRLQKTTYDSLRAEKSAEMANNTWGDKGTTMSSLNPTPIATVTLTKQH
ncbi:tetratricopeptide repeat protein [Dactylosporangium matsuzakiense]|uniref:tetratricopeptide repeat protein n=1 Tax=Dactylosporangium matsuzakiense TaxID=53360 RepID=UPI0021C31F29|nr:tetratricopeptide repeat protein [Dactylosporangium matsuzakiense]UWZ50228.1 tetratricopeptide repeat protein [Dactylosporangium matsuzakiense]